MSQTPETVLQLENVTAGYGRIIALNGIDLAVGQGQMVTLLGANGAGKTTTLKTISGLVREWNLRLAERGRADAKVYGDA